MVDGELLERLAEEKGYKPDEIANGAGVDVSTVYRAYNGKCSLGTADKLARFLKFTKDEAMAVFFAPTVA